MDSDIAPNRNEIEHVVNITVVNNEVPSEMASDINFEGENSKISSEIQVEFKTVSNVESEIQNTNNIDSANSGYITYESLTDERLV